MVLEEKASALRASSQFSWVSPTCCRLEDLLGEEMATRSSILAWKLLWSEESGGYSPWGQQRVGHDWATDQTHTALEWIGCLWLGQQCLLVEMKTSRKKKNHLAKIIKPYLKMETRWRQRNLLSINLFISKWSFSIKRINWHEQKIVTHPPG